ncbi:hypothetical protein CEXT_246751 [Caerostris extrusa]|uniref:Uncharacterized protein n=1 Tax=Caerostris extrusa TaxID=172846 RepID=A0AAV4NT90_CAEEX|nr:hypothetical protein CEXT_246751 [Caerostris extrusa]
MKDIQLFGNKYLTTEQGITFLQDDGGRILKPFSQMEIVSMFGVKLAFQFGAGNHAQVPLAIKLFLPNTHWELPLVRGQPKQHYGLGLHVVSGKSFLPLAGHYEVSIIGTDKAINEMTAAVPSITILSSQKSPNHP